MSLDLITQFTNPLFLVKIVLLVFLLFYAVFSFVIFNQVIVMDRIVKQVHSSFIIKTMIIINMFLAISLFLISLVIL